MGRRLTRSPVPPAGRHPEAHPGDPPGPVGIPAGPRAAAGAPIAAWRAWILAARIPTLPAAVVPVVVGTAAAAADGRVVRGAFWGALVAAVLIQVGTNLANDLFDYVKGADAAGRLGPPRVTQLGLLSPRQVAAGTAVSFGLAAAIGLYLTFLGGWPILVIGLLSIAAGVAYTAGPWPLAYHGLGEPFSFVFFGLVAVAGTYYLHTGAVTPAAVWVAVPVGLICTAILVVNNLRDIDTDRAAGKRTLAVRLGREGTRLEYACLVGAAYLAPLYLRLAGMVSDRFWLPWLSLPLAASLVRTVWAHGRGAEASPGAGAALNAALKRTGRLHLWYGLLLSGSLLW